MSPPPSTFRRVWAVPAVIALFSVVGLVVALLGDGVNDWFSWAGLATPIAVLLWARLRRHV